jgi:hypothetical protein
METKIFTDGVILRPGTGELICDLQNTDNVAILFSDHVPAGADVPMAQAVLKQESLKLLELRNIELRDPVPAAEYPVPGDEGISVKILWLTRESK